METWMQIREDCFFSELLDSRGPIPYKYKLACFLIKYKLWTLLRLIFYVQNLRNPLSL